MNKHCNIFFPFIIQQQHQIIHELQENLEQVTRDKMALEAKIMEMSSYKNEIMMLQNEIVKLQVSIAMSSMFNTFRCVSWPAGKRIIVNCFSLFIFGMAGEL